MRRREFLTLLGSSAVVWPLAARAQRTGKPPIIGFVSASNPSLAGERVAAFTQRLRELGWIEGNTITIEYRWEEGHFERAVDFFADLENQKVDVIVTHATTNVIAAKKATSTIPIIFAVASDPVGTGLVASLARPGSNVTGLSLQATDLAGKRLELLREVVPGFRQLAILVNKGNPASMLEAQGVEAAARRLKSDSTVIEIRVADDIAAAFDAIKGHADALYVCADPLIDTSRSRINALALDARLPTMEDNREFVTAAGLMSYGPNIPDLFRRSAEYVDKILRGTKPADIPVEQPIKFDLVVNRKTAKVLGLAIPPTLLATADEVIE